MTWWHGEESLHVILIYRLLDKVYFLFDLARNLEENVLD